MNGYGESTACRLEIKVGADWRVWTTPHPENAPITFSSVVEIQAEIDRLKSFGWDVTDRARAHTLG